VLWFIGILVVQGVSYLAYSREYVLCTESRSAVDGKISHTIWVTVTRKGYLLNDQVIMYWAAVRHHGHGLDAVLGCGIRRRVGEGRKRVESAWP
jgi:hypothetical protein